MPRSLTEPVRAAKLTPEGRRRLEHVRKKLEAAEREREKLVRTLRREGVSLRDIAYLLGVSPETIRNWSGESRKGGKR